jgi:hypothetical protein
MAKFVELTAIDIRIEAGVLRSQNQGGGPELDLDDEEMDDLERPVRPARPGNVVPLNTALPSVADAPEGMYSPVAVFSNDIREFYPRKDGKIGTRIVFINGSARIVKELYAEVKSKFEAL